MINEFPTHPDMVIKMALETCEYDQEKARSLLRSMGEEDKSKLNPSAKKQHARSSPKTISTAQKNSSMLYLSP